MKQTMKNKIMGNMIVTLIILFLIPFIPVRALVCDGPSYIMLINLTQLFRKMMSFTGLRSRWENTSIVLESIISIFFIFLIYEAVYFIRKKYELRNRNGKIKLMLKGNKLGYIIFSLGGTVFPYFVLIFIAGRYGGISQAPVIVAFLYQIFEAIEILMLPFIWIIFFIMKATSILLLLFSYLIEAGRFEFIGSPWDLSDLRVFGFIVLILFTAVGWYILSIFIGKVFSGFFKKR